MHLAGHPGCVGFEDATASDRTGPVVVVIEIGDDVHDVGRGRRDVDGPAAVLRHPRRLRPDRPCVGLAAGLAPPGRYPSYQSKTKGRPLARKWPTLMHSVRPIRSRDTNGWCTWPKSR